MTASYPVAVRAALEAALDTHVRTFSPVSGGMINRAARAATDAGTFFVKWNEASPAGFFKAEADGLALLRGTNVLRVPEVVYVGDRPETVGMLVLEYVESRPSANRTLFAEALGRRLAALHLSTVAPNAEFGLDYDNFLGSMPQENAWSPSWTAFYRDRRLAPQIQRARKLGRLPLERERRLMAVVEKLECLLSGLESRPALLHGDLWSGNYMDDGGEPVIFDPAAYYGEREMEIAYMELFGGFPPAVYAAYDEAYPLAEGYTERRTLHQLYHLLNHLNHFGGSYGSEVDTACRAYVV